MRRIRQLTLAVSLTLLLATSALAGESQTPSTVNIASGTVITEPEDGQTQSPGAAIKVTDPTLELVLSIMASLLPLI